MSLTARMNTWFALPRVNLALLLATTLVAALIALNEYSYLRSVKANNAMRDGVASRGAVNRVLRLMLNAETGQRGYLLTSDKKYLQPYEDATSQINLAMNDLRDVYARDNPGHQRLTAELSRSVQRKLTEMAVTLEVRHTSRSDEVWKFVLGSDLGKQYMDEVRNAAEAILANTSDEIDQGQRQISRALQISRISIALAALAALLSFYFYQRESDRLAQLGRDQRAALQHERDQLQEEVRRRTARLSELAVYLQNTTEREREYLARELHDELGALLTSAKFDVARLKSRMGDATPEVLERMQHLTDTLNGGIALKRRIIEDLRPSALSNLGLVSSLEILTRDYGERSGIDIVAHLEDVPLQDTGTQLTIYRLIQEALTNIGKYAKASQVQVRLARYEHHAEVEVNDNGRGFDPHKVAAGSHGLDGMRHRVEAAGGRLDIHSVPGQGTRIRAVLPYVKAQQEHEG